MPNIQKLFIHDKLQTKASFLYLVYAVFIVLFLLPLDWSFLKQIFSLKLFSFQYQDWVYLTTYSPNIIKVPAFGFASYGNWLLLVIIAFALAYLIKYLKKDNFTYGFLHEFTTTIIRYRLAIIAIAFGLIKLNHSQLPEPSLSDLNTSYGGFLPWKLYYVSTGYATSGYVPILGVVEIIIGLLLLSKKWYGLGAFFAATYFTNVVIANYAYSIGHHVFSSYVLLLAILLLVKYIWSFFRFFFAEKVAEPFAEYQYVKSAKCTRFHKLSNVFLALYFSIIALSVLFNIEKDNFPYSANKQYEKLSGLYNVESFVIDKDTIPYSITDSIRWQNVVIEKWNTISIKTAKPAALSFQRPSLFYADNEARYYDAIGNGDRHFYRFNIDSTNNSIALQGLLEAGDNYQFRIKTVGKDTILLDGNILNKPASIVLSKVDKSYLLQKGRRQTNYKI